jgi:hypothetical protein
VDFDPALIPCLMAECETWKGGGCIHIRKAGKPDGSRYFGKE